MRLSQELLLQSRVPVVLDIVICPSGELGSYDRPPAQDEREICTGKMSLSIDNFSSLPASDTQVKATYDVILFVRESPMLDVRTEIVEPSETAALTASLKA